jgi:hypothetical protein
MLNNYKGNSASIKMQAIQDKQSRRSDVTATVVGSALMIASAAAGAFMLYSFVFTVLLLGA